MKIPGIGFVHYLLKYGIKSSHDYLENKPIPKKFKKIFQNPLTFAKFCGILYKSPLIEADGSIAQLGEHLPYKQGVIGSSPIVSTNPAR